MGLFSGGGLGSVPPPLVVKIIPHLSLFIVILGTGAVMADMLPTPTFVTQGWSTITLLVVLGRWPILWRHIIMIVLVLIILPCAPMGWLVLSCLPLPIIKILTTSLGTIARSGPCLGVISPS